MIGQPSQQRPPVGYWDLWPNGPVPDSAKVGEQIRKNIADSTYAQNWHFYGQSVWDEETVPAGTKIESDVLCSTLGWILKIEMIAVTPSKNLFLTCFDSASGRELFSEVCTHNISGGEPGKAYSTFAYILGPRHPLHFEIENRSGDDVNASVILLGKLYRGEL